MRRVHAARRYLAPASKNARFDRTLVPAYATLALALRTTPAFWVGPQRRHRVGSHLAGALPRRVRRAAGGRSPAKRGSSRFRLCYGDEFRPPTSPTVAPSRAALETRGSVIARHAHGRLPRRDARLFRAGLCVSARARSITAGTAPRESAPRRVARAARVAIGGMPDRPSIRAELPGGWQLIPGARPARLVRYAENPSALPARTGATAGAFALDPAADGISTRSSRGPRPAP